MPSPFEVFLEFFEDDFSSAPPIFSGFTYIPFALFEKSLVEIGCYGYEIWRHKL